MPGMAFRKADTGESQRFPEGFFFKGFEGICRTGGRKTACGANQRADAKSVSFDEPDGDIFHESTGTSSSVLRNAIPPRNPIPEAASGASSPKVPKSYVFVTIKPTAPQKSAPMAAG